MKILERVESEAVTDVRCDVCSESTRLATGSLQYGRLEAQWGSRTAHDGERYEVHLCEHCFLRPSPTSDKSGGPSIFSRMTPVLAKTNWVWSAVTTDSATVAGRYLQTRPAITVVNRRGGPAPG